MLARRMRGLTSADMLEERSRGHALSQRRTGDLTPGSRVRSRGNSNTPALPAGTRSVLGLKAGVVCKVEMVIAVNSIIVFVCCCSSYVSFFLQFVHF